MKIIKPFLCIVFCTILSGCVTTEKRKTLPIISKEINRVKKSEKSIPVTNQEYVLATWHSVIILPDSKCTNISFCKKINPIWWFGNQDEPLPPRNYHTNSKCRLVKWYIRNPWSNFSAYTIGVSDKEFIRSGYYSESNWNPRGGWNFAIIQYKFFQLPFISYRRGKLDFYLGWRTSGAFGVKVNWIKRDDPINHPNSHKY